MALPYYETLLTLSLSLSPLFLCFFHLFNFLSAFCCVHLRRRVRLLFKFLILNFELSVSTCLRGRKNERSHVQEKLKTGCSRLITHAVPTLYASSTLHAHVRSIPRRFCSKFIAELEFSACSYVREKLITACPCLIVYAVPTSSTLRNAYVQFHKHWQHC